MKIFSDHKNMLAYEYGLKNEVYMGFNVYPLLYSDTGANYFIQKEKDVAEHTEDILQAEKLFSGTIKWDGCIDVIFADQDNCIPHFCGNPANQFKQIFDILYKFAAELMPEHKRYLTSQ